MLGERAARPVRPRVAGESLRAPIGRATPDGAGFERLLAELARALAGAPAEALDAQIRAQLGRMVVHLGVDVGLVAELAGAPAELQITHWYTRPGIALGLPPIVAGTFPWFAERMRAGDVVSFERVEDLPAQAGAERLFLERAGLGAGVLCPLVVDGSVSGTVSFHATRACAWPGRLLDRLQLTAQLFGSAVGRTRAEERLVAERQLTDAIVNGLPGIFFLLDRDGRIVRWNRNREIVTGWTAAELRGRHFLELAAPEWRRRLADAFARGFRDGCTTIEYDVLARDGSRIPHLATGRRVGCGGRDYLVVTATDISALRAAQEQVRRQQTEVAHVARLATMGELVAAIAHELNQPLAAIRTNAQAGRRMLAGGVGDSTEFEELFADVSADAVRADEIIRRLRDLLRRGEIERAPLDVPALLRGLEPLLRADALIHDVELVLDAADGIPLALGDRVHIQQVLLNLVRNAAEAIRDQPDGARQIVVACRAADAGTLEITVRDGGPRLDEATFARLFEPFYTTKPRGLGIGLALSRSIVEAHGGMLHATRNAERGLTLRCRLPCAPA